VFDLNLQAIIDAWPELPDDVREGVVAMVRAAQDTEAPLLGSP